MWADGHLQTRLENESLAKMIRCLAINMYPSIQVISGLWISDMSASETRQETLMTRLFSCSIRLLLYVVPYHTYLLLTFGVEYIVALSYLERVEISSYASMKKVVDGTKKPVFFSSSVGSYFWILLLDAPNVCRTESKILTLGRLVVWE